MEKEHSHTSEGKASIILGVIGFIFYFIGLFFYSFVGNRLIGIMIGMILGLIAFILGYMARKQNDDYGLIGMILGILINIIAIIVFSFTSIVFIETSKAVNVAFIEYRRI